MSILSALGLNPSETRWQDLARCKNVVQRFVGSDGNERVFDPLFDDYEDDEAPFPVRTSTDEMCLSCDVQRICYEYGRDNKETGVWGGVYLVDGKQDRTRNQHKTREVWARIREVLGNL